MKIIKYKKIRNKYRVFFDNQDKIDLYENVILNNNLLLKKEISEELLEKIKKENDKEAIYDISIKYISVKMRSKKEINCYLRKKGYEESDINRVVKKLEQNNLINDDNYAKAFIIDKTNLSTDGPNKIKSLLLKENISEEIIDKYLNEVNKDEVREKLNRLIDKKIKSIKNSSGNILKLKVINYFVNLGYDRYLIEELLNGKNLKKDNGISEYEKLYNKYSKKYSGYELENVLRQKLYQKGYEYDEIKRDIN